jgi:NtrC-family two-component system sensor histidine kinase KinB
VTLRRGGLRLRFGVAAGLLVLTTVTASVWTFLALSRLSGVVTDTVRQSESVTAVTSMLAGALEREDDAVLLILSANPRGRQVLAGERTVVDAAMEHLFRVLDPDDERELASPLKAELDAYRHAADDVISVAFDREALVQYHQRANPALRRAVARSTAIRDRHFEFARQSISGARDEAAAARRVVLVITLAALGIAVVVAWHLTRTIVDPVRRLTRGANALREAQFSEHIDLRSRDELGELAAAFNQMADDLSEFRRTNVGEVVRAKNTLEATLEALPDAVLLVDALGRIQSMNRAAVTTLAAAGVANPQCLTDLRLDGLDIDSVMSAIATGADAVSTSDLTRTIRVDRVDAVQRLLPRVVPVPAMQPQQNGAILLLYDVTELVRLDEMRSELVAVASHELQTPLTTLRMTLLMLQEGSETLPARQRELVATSLFGVEQLSETVREFLDLTRIEAGELRLNLEPVSVSVVVADAIRRAEAQAKAQAISLDVQLEGDRQPVLADASRLRAVFDNILSNALKYTPPGGGIRVESRWSARMAGPDLEAVSIAIADTGPGVPDEFRVRIFEKFFRLENHHTNRPHPRGAGIGLFMCRQIVELHGGLIRCTARPRGGTVITVTLPCVTRNAEGSVPEPETYAT